MALFVYFWFTAICMLQFHVKSFQNPCFKNDLQSTCSNQAAYDCVWSASAFTCICNTQPTMNVIYIINTNIQTKFNWNAIISSIQTVSSQLITFQDINTAIDAAFSLFSSYNTNYGQIRNILIVMDTTPPPATQTKLETLDIQTIMASSAHNEPHMISFISCEIHRYQHHLSLQRQSRVLLQIPHVNTHTTCCQCVTITATEGCPVDKVCEDRVCDTDRVCCHAEVTAQDPSHPLIGWDESCVHIATTICNEHASVINNPLPNPLPQPDTNTDTIRHHTCWHMVSSAQCSEYSTEYGCVWSATDEECMCNADDIPLNVIYLVDISLYAMPFNTDYDDIAQIIDDVTGTIVAVNLDSHSLIILYDDNLYIQSMDINATNVDVSQMERTQTNNLLYAIDTALNHFILFNNNNRRVLVLFNGQVQSHYPADVATVCAKRGELERNGISIIINSYLVHDGIESPRDLQCLMSVNNHDAYNTVPYIAIHGASTRNGGWDGFPFKAKLSWDICQAAKAEDTVHRVPTTDVRPLDIENTARTVANPTELLEPNVQLQIEGIDTVAPTVRENAVSSPTQATVDTKRAARIPSRFPTRYIYKPRITARCPEPKEICIGSQIFNERICKCQCAESVPSICPDLMIYNAISCECEVYHGLAQSDLFDIDTQCVFDGELDVLFVIDSSCGLDAVSCDNKGELVSHLAQIITQNGDDHRVGVLQCGEAVGAQYTIPLDDDTFDEINSDLSLDRLDAFDLYFNKIKSGLQCVSGAAVPKRECLQEAVAILSSDSQTEEPRVGKVVSIEICGVMEGEEPCDAGTEWLRNVNSNEIEIILVHIGEGISEDHNECLLRNGAQSVYRFDSFDFNLLQNIEMTTRLVNGICSSNIANAIEDTVSITDERVEDAEQVGAVSNRDVAPIPEIQHGAIIENGNGNWNGNVDINENESSDSSTNVNARATVNDARRVNPVRIRVVDYGSGSSSSSSSSSD